MEQVLNRLVEQWGAVGALVVLLIVYRRHIGRFLSSLAGTENVLEVHTSLLQTQAKYFEENLVHFKHANRGIEEFLRETKQLHQTVRELLATSQRIEAELREHHAYYQGLHHPGMRE